MKLRPNIYKTESKTFQNFLSDWTLNVLACKMLNVYAGYMVTSSRSMRSNSDVSIEPKAGVSLTAEADKVPQCTSM